MLWREKWDEWRGRWCWITEKDPQLFCMRRQTKLTRDNGWSALDPRYGELAIAIDRIKRLKAVRLTIEMIGADFLRRRIGPL